MQVTRHFSLTSETDTSKTAPSEGGATPLRLVDSDPATKWFPAPIRKSQLIGFCDWLTIYQRHGSGLPVIADGAVIRIDKHGETESTTLKKSLVEGSHETACFLRCDGDTVWFDGNVSKFGRPDNVFGYSFQQCLLIINNIVQAHGLPPFTEGEKFMTNVKGDPVTVWTGARIARLDMTQNFAVGSKADAYHFMRWLNGQQASRLKTGTYGDGETVDFGKGSRRVYSKAYQKGPELRRNNKAGDPTNTGWSKVRNAYVDQLAEWCDSVGLIRWETTFKSTKLIDMGCQYLGGLDMAVLETAFADYQSVMTRADAEADELTDLPKPLLATYRMWQAGDDITSKVSRATYFRHRRELLPYGIDIAIRSTVATLQTKTRVIKLGPVSPPDWYELPEIERKRYVANGG